MNYSLSFSNKMGINKLLLTGVWQNGGSSAKLNICNSNTPTTQSRKTLSATLKTTQPTRNEQ